MDDLHVNDKLLAIVIDNQDTDATTARLKGLGQSRPKVGLVDDRKGLLNITSLSHGNDYSMSAM